MNKLILIAMAFALGACDFIVTPYYETRNRISGTYDLYEFSESYRTHANYPITLSTYGSTVYIDNFYGTGLTVKGQIAGNTINIHRQFQSGYEIQGVVTVNGCDLRLTYSVRDTYARQTDFCNSTASRQYY